MDESKIRDLLPHLTEANRLLVELLEDQIAFHIETEKEQMKSDKEYINALKSEVERRKRAEAETEQFSLINADLLNRLNGYRKIKRHKERCGK